MDKPLSKEESYAERRQLFKNIWETAMNISEKDDIMNKPKVIKYVHNEVGCNEELQELDKDFMMLEEHETLRLDQVDRCAIGTKKKQRIKNLRTVCNKILDFCDRQDADDLFYEQMGTEGVPPSQLRNKILKPRKPKNQGIKKIKKSKSLSSPFNEAVDPRATISDRKEEDLIKTFKVSRNTSPIKHSTLKRLSSTCKQLKAKLSKKNLGRPVTNSAKPATDMGTIRRKTVRKKRIKRKKSSETLTEIGGLKWPEP